MKNLNAQRALQVIRWIRPQFHFLVFWHTTISRHLINEGDIRLGLITLFLFVDPAKSSILPPTRHLTYLTVTTLAGNSNVGFNVRSCHKEYPQCPPYHSRSSSHAESNFASHEICAKSSAKTRLSNNSNSGASKFFMLRARVHEASVFPWSAVSLCKEWNNWDSLR
jgi:hypothetical protein